MREPCLQTQGQGRSWFTAQERLRLTERALVVGFGSRVLLCYTPICPHPDVAFEIFQIALAGLRLVT